MFKYIVTWVISTIVSEPCPNTNSSDEFGINNSFSACSVLHISSVKETKTKEFMVRDSAYVFYNKGKGRILGNGEWFGGLGSRVSEIKIDSVKISNIQRNEKR